MRDIEELVEGLKNHDWSVRYNSVEMLGQMRDKKAAEALIPLLKDKNRFVRQEAATTLGKMGDKASTEPLKQATEQEKNEFVLKQMKKAVETLG